MGLIPGWGTNVSNSVQSHRQQPTGLPCPWDSPGKNTGVGCHYSVLCLFIPPSFQAPSNHLAFTVSVVLPLLLV